MLVIFKLCKKKDKRIEGSTLGAPQTQLLYVRTFVGRLVDHRYVEIIRFAEVVS